MLPITSVLKYIIHHWHDIKIYYTSVCFGHKKEGRKRKRDSFITISDLFLTCSFLPLPPSRFALLKTWTRTKQCSAPSLILIRLIFLFTCQIILCWPYRYKKNVCVIMYACVWVSFCCSVIPRIFVRLNLCVFISLTRKNNCMFTNIKEEKFWTGPVSKVAHIHNLCTAAGSNCCCMNLCLIIMGMEINLCFKAQRE